MSANEAIISYIIETMDRAVGDECEAAFPGDEVSVSSNLIGGLEIAIFFAVALRPAKEILAMILKFQTDREKRFQSAKIVIGKDAMEITGYGPSDLKEISKLPMVVDVFGAPQD
jgi:hypothetical protein